MGFGWPLLRRSGLGIGSRSLELDWPPCSAAWTGLSKTALSPPSLETDNPRDASAWKQAAASILLNLSQRLQPRPESCNHRD